MWHKALVISREPVRPSISPTRYMGPIIDAHHHLWDLRLGRHAWLAPSVGTRGGLGNLGPLRRNYLPADYARDAVRFPIAATVHVEAGWLPTDCLGETRWLDGLDKTDGIAARYVAQVPLASPEAPALIEAQAASTRVAGVRDILSWHSDPTRRFATRGDLMQDAVWRANLGRLGAHALVFDLMVFAHQLPEAAQLAGDFPDQIFVLNHCGSPIDRDPDGMRVWRHGLETLARNPNVRIKISDLVAYDPHWTLDSLATVVLPCIDCFGPERAMFASDFPVAGLRATFDEVFDAFINITVDLSPCDQHALFFGTAWRTYRFDELASTTTLGIR